jgi:Asp-tRNA(Asn)/Glu-tRNA(Gln) amidotransferase A subunit family amidase
VRECAKRLDADAAGPLRGTLVGVKDVIDTADSPTGYGSPLFSEHLPAADADVVACLRAAAALQSTRRSRWRTDEERRGVAAVEGLGS